MDDFVVFFLGIPALGMGPALVAGRLIWKRTDPNRNNRHATVIIAVVAAVTYVCVTGISGLFGYVNQFPPRLGRILGIAIIAGLVTSFVVAFGFYVDLWITRSKASKGERADRAPGPERRAVLGRSIASVVGAFTMAVWGIKPSFVATPIELNETVARQILVVSARAQFTFRRTDFYGIGRNVFANPVNGRGFADVFELELKDDLDHRPLNALRAYGMDETSAYGKPCGGYYYTDISRTREGPYDYRKEFGLCAFPALYGRSGINTYVIDASGAIYYKDTGGSPVTTWPDVEAEGWAKPPASVH